MRWSDLEPPWQSCVQLALEAYGRDTTPVGAVIVDGGGREVARGRNARYDPGSPGELAGSHVETLSWPRSRSCHRQAGTRTHAVHEPRALSHVCRRGAHVAGRAGAVRRH